MKSWNQSFSKSIACAALVLSLISCVNNGSDDRSNNGGTTPTAQTACIASGSGGGGTTPSAQAGVTITAPNENATVPVGPVTVSFTTDLFTIGTPGQNNLHFYLDADPVPYMFYNGPSINDNNGVCYKGSHTHFVHWKSATPLSFDIFGLPSTSHIIRFVLADHNDNELANPEATKTLNFSVSLPPTGDLQLEQVQGGLNFPVGLSQAPDGRIFYNERLTGAIRIISPGWQLNPTACVQIPVSVGAEQGLLGLTLDPNFASNHYVYVYYTAFGLPTNRVARYTESNGVCTSGTIILDNLPTANNHNGGIIQFGPDGKLYVVIGDAEDASNAQLLTSLAGKILRVNPNGSAPSDNPFFSNPNANAKLVFSRGHRNSYGFTFHPHTKDLWESENGDDDNDEINRVVAGGNYGWDVNRRMGILNEPPLIDPIAVFFPLPCDPLVETCKIAPTGIIAIPEDSTAYPEAYRNNLLFADFIFGQIRRVVLTGDNLDQLGTSSIAFNGGNGGLLSLMLGADGFVYVSNTNAIFKVVHP
jgi:glucose/arabinose dehydrogenase